MQHPEPGAGHGDHHGRRDRPRGPPDVRPDLGGIQEQGEEVIGQGAEEEEGAGGGRELEHGRALLLRPPRLGP